jgi:hypothetical protein
VLRETLSDVRRQPGVEPSGVADALQDVHESPCQGHTRGRANSRPDECLRNLAAMFCLRASTAQILISGFTGSGAGSAIERSTFAAAPLQWTPPFAWLATRSSRSRGKRERRVVSQPGIEPLVPSLR